MTCYTIIEDSYKWLPPYGENSIEFYSKGSDVILEIHYEEEMDDGTFIDKRKDYTFKHCVSFNIISFPGVGNSVYGQDCDSSKESLPLDSLFKFNHSILAREWTKHFNFLFELYNFCQIFTTENKMVDVVCESVSISDEIIVH